MGKFTDGLEKWVQERDKRQKKRRQDASAVEFLAVKKDVAEAIEAGYSLKTIWEYLKEGKKILVESGLDLINAVDLKDAAEKLKAAIQ